MERGGRGGGIGEVSIFQRVTLGQRQAVISLGTHWHKLDKSGLLFQSRLKTGIKTSEKTANILFLDISSKKEAQVHRFDPN